MALIKCKECGKEISGTAESCPHCGYRTAHGRSITEAKVLFAQWIIAAALIIVGLILFFANVADFIDLSDYLEYYSSFSDEGKEIVVKFIFGIAFLIGGIIDLVIIKSKADSITGNGFEAEQRNRDSIYAKDSEQQQFWECASCGQRNFKTVQACQCCGTTRAWLEQHSKVHTVAQDEWKCPECGRVNKKYVTTCPCGHTHIWQPQKTILNTRWECEQCHGTNPPTAMVCMRCGANRSATTSKNEEMVTCPKCGKTHKKGANFCTDCGTKL